MLEKKFLKKKIKKAANKWQPLSYQTKLIS
jgi:hypothetical protein